MTLPVWMFGGAGRAQGLSSWGSLLTPPVLPAQAGERLRSPRELRHMERHMWPHATQSTILRSDCVPSPKRKTETHTSPVEMMTHAHDDCYLYTHTGVRRALEENQEEEKKGMGREAEKGGCRHKNVDVKDRSGKEERGWGRGQPCMDVQVVHCITGQERTKVQLFWPSHALI